MFGEVTTALFLILGSLFVFVTNLGILVMPNTLSRAHALSKGMTLGLLLMLIGLWAQLFTEGGELKILLAIVFQCITIPVAGHLFAYYTLRGEE